eukprot:3645276-Heterocapsa_arctica.AAC.1
MPSVTDVRNAQEWLSDWRALPLQGRAIPLFRLEMHHLFSYMGDSLIPRADVVLAPSGSRGLGNLDHRKCLDWCHRVGRSR